MSERNDGGPAFASQFRRDEEGMSLRDYFAAKAMPQLVGGYPLTDGEVAGIAKSAYQIADAMLKARRK